MTELLFKMAAFGNRFLVIAVVLVAFGLAPAAIRGAVAQQNNYDAGKSPPQLFANDCSVCHKSPQGLAKSGFGVEGFLREHYTASKESAAALARYLASFGDAPAARAGKPRAKPVDAKPKTDKKPADAKAGDVKPDEAKPTEAKPASAAPAAAPAPEKTSPAPEAKPAEGKTEKSE